MMKREEEERTVMLEMCGNSGEKEERTMSEIEMQRRGWGEGRGGAGAESFMRVSLWRHQIFSHHL